MILDVISEFLSSTFSLPARLATFSVAVLMFVCGTAFLVIAALLVIHATSAQEWPLFRVCSWLCLLFHIGSFTVRSASYAKPEGGV